MITLHRTSADDPAFRHLVSQLNAELAGRDGPDHPLTRFNDPTGLRYVLLAYAGKEVVGCGALARYGEASLEIKRMFVVPGHRGRRVGEQILRGLEDWSRELGGRRCLLFTGPNQPEARKLYERNGYRRVERYGPLRDIPDCLCFARDIRLD
ncbi:GNAT family N-acetyltransferase [Lewinella sp. W8]|uniref:GNAT family N-acetyltransferase n=1 Tax=Lewinella sp. W8 TaxID=2528208 RepID=UPI001067FD10|nr:GNAT family N-acetyltransferase [Lewinella sp. W8]MTB50760.1 GNAT family N-acetyltransferase [Lewinella sp. W8]